MKLTGRQLVYFTPALIVLLHIVFDCTLRTVTFTIERNSKYVLHHGKTLTYEEAIRFLENKRFLRKVVIGHEDIAILADAWEFETDVYRFCEDHQVRVVVKVPPPSSKFSRPKPDILLPPSYMIFYITR